MRFAAAFIFFASRASAETITEYLFSNHTAPELNMTRDIARSFQMRYLKWAASSFGKVSIMLPTDEAWREKLNWYNKLLGQGNQAQTLRFFTTIAGVIETGEVGGFDTLLDFVNKNGGSVYTSYGTPLTIDRTGKACFDFGDDKQGKRKEKCTQLQVPPLEFDDASVYMVDEILLPDDLIAKLEAP